MLLESWFLTIELNLTFKKNYKKWGIVANLGFFRLHVNSSSMHLGFELLNLVLLSNACLFQ
jgi:hypothetical protein